jgi:SAM-dependent methyltransferase
MSTCDSARELPRRKSPTVPFFWPEWIIQREIAAHVRRSLDGIGGRLLDVGCGEKPFLVYRAPTITDWIGFDVPENKTADVRGYAESLPFEDASFDAVLCTEVLEHVAEPERVLAEISRVLKAGGCVILTTPLYWPLHEEPYDFFRFTPYGLRHLLTKVGLDAVTVMPLACGFRMTALAVNTCFNAFGKGLPWGETVGVKALFVPIYIVVNATALVMSLLFPSRTNSVGTGIVARKKHG